MRRAIPISQVNYIDATRLTITFSNQKAQKLTVRVFMSKPLPGIALDWPTAKSFSSGHPHLDCSLSDAMTKADRHRFFICHQIRRTMRSFDR